MKYFLIFSLVVVALCLFEKDSYADLITFAYEGTVNTTGGYPDPAPFAAFTGQALKVVYTFESTTPDSNASANGDYSGAVTAISINLGGNTYSANTGNIIIINNGTNPDQYIVDIPTGLSGPAVGGVPVSRFQIIFTDTTKTAFASDALPTVQPDPSIPIPFTDTAMWLDYLVPLTHPDISGLIMAENNITAVPEPSLMVLLGISVLSIAGLKRWWKN